MARDEALANSDVDILVDFGESPTFDRYLDLLSYLEQVFGQRVDMVTRNELKPRARCSVEQDLIDVS